MTITRKLIFFLASITLFSCVIVSVVVIKNTVSNTWQRDRQEDAEYAKSPNCMKRLDNLDVDSALPPCQDVSVIVVEKSQKIVDDYRRYRNYPRVEYSLTLRDVEGHTRKISGVYADLWNSLHVGDPITATIWRNKITHVSANGYSNAIVDTGRWTQEAHRLTIWGIIAVVCVACLRLLWVFRGSLMAPKSSMPIAPTAPRKDYW